MNTEIRQALARGYCSKENEMKVLDSELIEAMALEVEKVISHLHQSAAQKRKEALLDYKQFVLNVLDGVDIADGYCNTKAIRLALQSRNISSDVTSREATPPTEDK